MPPQSLCPNHAAMKSKLEEGSKSFDRLRKDIDQLFDIARELAKEPKAEALREEVMQLRETTIRLTGEIENTQKLTDSQTKHLEEKIDDIKKLITDSMARIEASANAPMKAVEKLSEKVENLEKEPGKRALEDRRKMAFEIVKWVAILGLGAVLALKG